MSKQYFKELNGFYVKDEESIRYYDTVSDMKSDTKLVAGQYVKTKGYHSINDGGSSEYFIRSKTGEDIEDNGTIHFIGNYLVAELIIDDEVNVKQFGAYGDNSHDDTISINNAINTGLKVLFNNGTYLCNIEITDDKKLDIYGINSVLKPYDSTKPIIKVSSNSIITTKSIQSLNFELEDNESGIFIGLPSFVDNYYPKIIKISNLDFQVTNDFTGKCIELNYIRELDIDNISMKRVRGDDSSRTGIGFDLVSCMNLTIHNSNIGFFDKAVYIHNGTMSSEGIKIVSTEFFFNNYGVYAIGSSNKAILDLRIDKCMIDQIQTSGVYLDGVTSSSVINNWLGANVNNSNGIEFNSTNRENFGCNVIGNTIALNLSTDSYGILITDSANYHIRGLNITSNIIQNYLLYGIKSTATNISMLSILSNIFNTSSSNTSNSPFNYSTQPTKTLVSGNINNGAPIRDGNLSGTINYGIRLEEFLTTTDFTTGSTQRNDSLKNLYVTISCRNTSPDNRTRLSVFLGQTQNTMIEAITELVEVGTDGGFTRNISFIVPPMCYYTINPGSTCTIDKITGIKF